MKKLIFCFLAVILLIGAAGCGQNAELLPVTSAYQYSSADVNTQTEELRHSFGLDKSWAESTLDRLTGGSSSATMAPEVIIQAPPATTTAITIPAADGSYTPPGAVIPAERMVIKTANIALVVEDVNITLQQINNLASANGGYVISSNIQEDKNRLYGNISFKVEAGKFEQTLKTLRDLSADVRSETTSGQDVTEEYVDLDARLSTLEASKAQLMVLMEKAGKVEEILEVQKELTNTNTQIEQIKGRMQYLQQSAALSTIYASLEQSKLAVEFIAYPQTVKEGQKVQFNPVISGGFQPYSFEWSFGDGQTSTDDAPSHVYKKKGTYSITLTVKDDKGGTAVFERKDYITIISGWDAGNTANSAVNGLKSFGRFLGSLFIWLGVLSPIWIVILAVVLYFAWWKRRKKKA